MSGQGRVTRLSSILSARAMRLASRIGLYLLDTDDGEQARSSRRRGRTRSASRQNGSHATDSDSGSLSGEEDENNSDKDAEELDHGDCDRRQSSHRKISKKKEKSESVAPLEHALAHLTSLGVAPSAGSTKFGRVKGGQTVNTLHMLAGREINVSNTGKFSEAERRHVATRFLPEDGPSVIDRINSRAYIGQFSGDGTLFIAGFQDRRIRIYDVDKGWSIRKDVIARNLRWTVTDTALSPDQRFLVYASISPIVHLVNVGNESGGIQSLANVTDIHEGLNFGSDDGDSAFGIWSLQFSQDGREIVAGGSDKSIYVYDLEANKRVCGYVAHKDEVNAVAFSDESSHLIFSGSDDHNCKVWDRRCFAINSKPAGILFGHLEGITFIDSKRDGRHFISNGKDQTLKLWDIRKMSSGPPNRSKLPKIPTFNWDYRWMEYPGMNKDIRHPYDQSLMTYKGHLVLQTLIRCYFSPVHRFCMRFIQIFPVNYTELFIVDEDGKHGTKIHLHWIA
ncbi:hypothetical protein O6H91_04G096100 [Diphasiastrum complanatum]|uniref:Uncharacterized protein n=1 Tax=Diphasiastrum complanatum TaxID=34168 RepID=A0ACC2DZL3_DIPCM|nr:hypothetical protein O6H91_04G096100 [Diphasiastrum complanatum]